MSLNKKVTGIFISVLCHFFVFSQDAEPGGFEKVLINTDQIALKEFAIADSASYYKNRMAAVEWALLNNYIVRLEKDDYVIELQGFDKYGFPEYHTTYNADAAETTSTNHLYPGGILGLDLTGNNMTGGVWDSGNVRSTHQEFNNTGSSRVFNQNSSSETRHATHVTGTIIAGGVVPQAKGMAYNATVLAHDWNNHKSEMANAASQGLLLSNHSYGIIAGWRWNSSEDIWYWYGNTTISELEDYRFGFYDSHSEDMDYIAYNAPYYLIVKSAGNHHGLGPSSQPVEHFASYGSEWVLSNEIRDLDGGEDGFDCLSSWTVSKNILTVGAIHDIPGGYSDPTDVVIASFSSRGPTDDGRIKPDIVANGIGLYSPNDESDNTYSSLNGTSMSTPNVTGSLLLLQEYYEQLNNEFMRSATLKALVIHTADESGENEGPDYVFGWGLLNTAKAADLITSNEVMSLILEETLHQGNTYSREVTATGDQPLIVTIAWTDPPGNPVPAQLNPTDIMLVNDLDLIVVRETDTIYPFVLDGQNPGDPAYRGVNNVDNVENVVVNVPQPGDYSIYVSHKGDLMQGFQPFSIIVNGINEMEIHGELFACVGETSQLGVDFEPAETNPWISSYPDIADIDDNGLVTALAEGITEITFTSDKGYTVSVEFTVLSYPFQAGVISGANEVCQGQTNLHYSVPQIPNADSYLWTFPSGVSGTSNTENIILDFSNNAVSGEITVMGQNICGPGVTSSIEITVNPLPDSAGAISGQENVCQGETNIIYFIEEINYADNYVWTFPDGFFGFGNTENISVDIGNDAVSGHIVVMGQNSCGYGDPSILEITVNSLPGAAGTISGEGHICQGEEGVLYSVPEILNAESYLWSIPSGATGTSAGNQINIDFGTDAVSGVISVAGVNECGTGNSSHLGIIVSPLPGDAGEIFGDINVCEEQEGVMYSVSEIEHAEFYVWTIPYGASGTSNDNNITLDFSSTASSGTLSVMGQNSCGHGVGSSLNIIVNPKPPIPTIVLNNNILYSDAPEGNQWFNQYGEIFNATDNEFVVNQSGDYYVIVTISGCESDPSNIITVNLNNINDFASSTYFEVYPNPASDFLTISIPDAKHHIINNTDIEIINKSGKVVYFDKLSSYDMKIDIYSFSSGLYSVKLIYKTGITLDTAVFLKIR